MGDSVLTDSVAPSVPTNLQVTRDSPTQVTLSWDASTDPSGVAYYIVWQDDVDIAHVNAPAVSKVISGLTQDTSYTFKVSAVDTLGNTSAKSSGLTTKAWVPYDIANVILAHQANSLTLTSGLISSWTDLSANAYHSTQGTAGNRGKTDIDGDNIVSTGWVGGKWLVNANAAVIQAGSITIAFWAKFDEFTSNPAFFGSWQGGGNLWSKAEYSTSNSRVEWHFSSTGANDAFGYFATTDKLDWHHYVFRYDASQATNATRCRIWCDGIEKVLTFSGTIPASLFAAANNFALAAAVAGGTGAFRGRMDNVAYYSRAITTDEIADLYAYRPRAKGTVYRAAEFTVSSNTAYYTITDDDDLSAGNGSTEWSLCFRANPDATGLLSQFIFNKKGFAANHEFSIRRDAFAAASSLDVLIGTPFGTSFAQWTGFWGQAAQWTHAAVIYNGNLAEASRVKLYKDGVDLLTAQNKSGSWPATLTNQAQDMIIATLAGSEAASRWDGRLADIAIFNRALTPSEVSTCFNFGAVSTPGAHYLIVNDDDGDSSSADGDAGGAVNQVIDATGHTTGVISGTLDGWQQRNYP